MQREEQQAKGSQQGVSRERRDRRRCQGKRGGDEAARVREPL